MDHSRATERDEVERFLGTLSYVAARAAPCPYSALPAAPQKRVPSSPLFFGPLLTSPPALPGDRMGAVCPLPPVGCALETPPSCGVLVTLTRAGLVVYPPPYPLPPSFCLTPLQ